MNHRLTEDMCGPVSEGHDELTAQLLITRKAALDATAAALQSIILQQKLTIMTDSPCGGNISDAKKHLVDAMVDLAVASSYGSYPVAKKILAGYGLDDMI